MKWIKHLDGTRLDGNCATVKRNEIKKVRVKERTNSASDTMESQSNWENSYHVQRKKHQPIDASRFQSELENLNSTFPIKWWLAACT